jgi:hypothetical protein
MINERRTTDSMMIVTQILSHPTVHVSSIALSATTQNTSNIQWDLVCDQECSYSENLFILQQHILLQGATLHGKKGRMKGLPAKYCALVCAKCLKTTESLPHQES